MIRAGRQGAFERCQCCRSCWSFRLTQLGREASPFCGEPPNCPFTVMVTVPAKLNFVRIDRDLELNRIRPEEAMQREIEGAISMTKTIMVPGNPPAHQTLNTPINSIVAAAKTAHELESARRKATRDQGQTRPPIPKQQS